MVDEIVIDNINTCADRVIIKLPNNCRDGMILNIEIPAGWQSVTGNNNADGQNNCVVRFVFYKPEEK